MKPFRSSLFLLCLICFGCDRDKSKERREFGKLEAAIGMVAGAEPEDRAIRLEQLQKLPVETDKVNGLKKLCLSSYTTFDAASRLLDEAKADTGKIEAEIAVARKKKDSGRALSPEDERRLITLSRNAAASLAKVTRELDRAEKLVATCEERRLSMRAEMLSK